MLDDPTYLSKQYCFALNNEMYILQKAIICTINLLLATADGKLDGVRTYVRIIGRWYEYHTRTRTVTVCCFNDRNHLHTRRSFVFEQTEADSSEQRRRVRRLI